MAVIEDTEDNDDNDNEDDQNDKNGEQVNDIDDESNSEINSNNANDNGVIMHDIESIVDKESEHGKTTHSLSTNKNNKIDYVSSPTAGIV